MRLFNSAFASAIMCVTGATAALAPNAAADNAICEAKQVVFYYLPGDASLSEINQELAANLADRAYGCIVKNIAVEAFSDTRDGEAVGEDLSSARAESVLTELDRLGVRPHDTTVRLHVRRDLVDEDAQRFLGRKAVVTLQLEDRGVII